MTGTNCDFVYTQIVPVMFEPPCIMQYMLHTQNFSCVFDATTNCGIIEVHVISHTSRLLRFPMRAQN